MPRDDASALLRPRGAGPTARGVLRSTGARAAGDRERRSGLHTRRLLVVLSVLAVLTLLLVPTLRSYLRQQSEIDTLRTRVAQQERSVKDLEAEKKKWADPAYVKQQARARLKFAMPGERTYTVIDADPSEPTSGGIAAVPMTGDRSWYAQLWESARLADHPEGTP